MIADVKNIIRRSQTTLVQDMFTVFAIVAMTVAALTLPAFM
jgi:hypothetical protein